MGSLPDSNVFQAIENVRKAAQADVARTGQAHVDLLGAIRQLNLAAETPAETLMRMRFQPLQSTAIRMALEAGVFKAICDNGSKSVGAPALAKATGYDALLITRIMRLVSYCGVVDEVAPAEYAANEMTRLINTPGMSGAERHHFDLFFPVAANIVEYMKETKVHQFPSGPEDKSPWEHTWNMSLWEFFDRFPEHRVDFDNYMQTRRKGLVKWHETFPIAKELGPGAKKDKDDVMIVDVGGNKGHELESFHETHPEVSGRLILQDLDAMIERVEKNGPPKGVEAQVYDFFTPQPIKGARAYYFRNICHDWPDRECITFLSNTARSMEPGYSRILIDDYVLPDTGAPVRGSSMDLLMMLYCSGIERTLSQWRHLLDASGLEIVKVWGTRSDFESVIEARLKA